MNSSLAHLIKIKLSRSAVINNIAFARRLAGDEIKIIPVLKANAYGHGLKEMLEILSGVVDTVQLDDFRELCEARPFWSGNIWVLGYVRPDQIIAGLDTRVNDLAIIDDKVSFMLADGEHLREIEALLEERQRKLSGSKLSDSETPKKLKVHLAIDLEFGREGTLVGEVSALLRRLKESAYVQLEGIYGHLANADEEGGELHTARQHQYFSELVEEAHRLGFSGITPHLSATPGIVRFYLDQRSIFKAIRLGIGVYGVWPAKELKDEFVKSTSSRTTDLHAAQTATSTPPKLIPVLTWETEIVQVKNVPSGYPLGYGSTYHTKRPTRLGLLPLGYSDGLDRRLSNNLDVLVRGQRCPILGRVSMNMTIIDLTELPTAQRGDTVTLLGVQGTESITMEELGPRIKTNTYEMFTKLPTWIWREVVE